MFEIVGSLFFFRLAQVELGCILVALLKQPLTFYRLRLVQMA